MHPIRKLAETAYKAAIANWNHASCGADAAAFEVANQALQAARLVVVKAELDYPTNIEILTAKRVLKIRNRGLDF